MKAIVLTEVEAKRVHKRIDNAQALCYIESSGMIHVIKERVKMNTPKKTTIETIKTIALTAFVAGTIGLISGYFASINLHGNARAQVVQDMQIVKTTPAEEKKADQ